MTRSRHQLGRRTVLRGMVGGGMVTLGLPVLEAMLDAHGEAFADGSTPPVRFMVWFWGDGAAPLDIEDPDGPPLFAPEQTGADYPLTPQLAGLADVRDYCSVLSGFQFTNTPPGLRPHHTGLTSFLSGYDYTGTPPTSEFGGPTIDHVLAEVAGQDTFLPSLQVSVTKRAAVGEGPTIHYVSAASATQPIASITSPQEVWDLLFGSFSVPGDPSIPGRLARIDAVMADLSALERRLGVADRIRLEAHIDGLAQLADQIEALPPICQTPDVPEQENVDIDFQEPLVEVNAVLSQLVAYAFACDVTRIVNFRFSSSLGDTVLSPIGQTMPRHGITHFVDADSQAEVDDGTIFIVEQFATTLQTLIDTPDGAGNLADNSTILMTTDCGVGYHHTTTDIPCIVAGRGGGALVHPGIHYRSEGASTSDIVLTCARTVAPDLESFGDGPGLSTTEVDAIKT